MAYPLFKNVAVLRTISILCTLNLLIHYKNRTIVLLLLQTTGDSLLAAYGVPGTTQFVGIMAI